MELHCDVSFSLHKLNSESFLINLDLFVLLYECAFAKLFTYTNINQISL